MKAQLIDKITFTEEIVRERSITPVLERLGKHESTMELWWNGNCYYIEWGIPELDEGECIGIEVQENTKIVTGYDGIMCIPEQAIQLLKKNGFNTDEIE